MASREIIFFGGPFHECRLPVKENGGILPMNHIISVPSSSKINRRYAQNFIHYGLHTTSSGLICYILLGYSKDGKHLTDFGSMK